MQIKLKTKAIVLLAALAAFLNLWIGIFMRQDSMIVMLVTNVALIVVIVESILRGIGLRDGGKEVQAEKDNDSRLFLVARALVFLAIVFLMISHFGLPKPEDSIDQKIQGLQDAKARILNDYIANYENCNTEGELSAFRQSMVEAGEDAIPLLVDVLAFTENQKLQIDVIRGLEKITGKTLLSANSHEVNRALIDRVVDEVAKSEK